MGGWSTPRHGRFAPGKIRYAFHKRLCEPQGRAERVRKICPPPEFGPGTVQPVTSRYPGPHATVVNKLIYFTYFQKVCVRVSTCYGCRE